MIKFSKSNISQKTLIDVKNVLKNGWLTHGKFSQNFENEFKNIPNQNIVRLFQVVRLRYIFLV